jgi:hypothetical protein
MSMIALRRLPYKKSSNMSGEKPSYGFIKEDLIDMRFSLILKKNSPLNKAINVKIDQLIESGIMKHVQEAELMASLKIAAKVKKEEKQQKDAEQLTMEHLELCFYAILIGLALSCVVFLVELMIGYCSSL